MELFEYSTCDKCGKSYKGKFVVGNNGTVRCYDCDSPVEHDGIEFDHVDVTQDHLLSEIVKDLLIKDTKRIFIPKSESDLNELEFLRDEDGNIELDKLYFQGNTIELVLKAHKKAYKCLEYIESGQEKYKEKAENVLNKYLSMREVKFSKEEEDKFLGELENEEMKEIESEVSVL